MDVSGAALVLFISKREHGNSRIVVSELCVGLFGIFGEHLRILIAVV